MWNGRLSAMLRIDRFYATHQPRNDDAPALRILTGLEYLTGLSYRNEYHT